MPSSSASSHLRRSLPPIKCSLQVAESLCESPESRKQRGPFAFRECYHLNSIGNNWRYITCQCVLKFALPCSKHNAIAAINQNFRCHVAKLLRRSYALLPIEGSIAFLCGLDYQCLFFQEILIIRTNFIGMRTLLDIGIIENEVPAYML
jgi:hypothetical protein